MEKKVQNSSENPAQGYNEQYRYDERNRLVQKQLWENGFATPADTTTYTYDAQGSLLSEQGSDLCRKYLYNDFHQCICTEVIRGREEEAERILQENRYDGEGLRFSLIENGKRTDFITNGWDNLAELDENGQVTKRIIRGMGIVASEDVEEHAEATEAIGNTNGAIGNIIDATTAFAGTAYHYYHGNERMDVEFITDEASKVVNGYTYDAFGTIITSTEKLQNRYTYNGEAFDKTTEQYYLRKRFYNPKLSRFIQEDEYRGDGLNLYAFCANNPVMYVDPSGYKKRQVTYRDREIYINGNNVGSASYRTGEYLNIALYDQYVPKRNDNMIVNSETLSNRMWNEFNLFKRNPRQRGKNIENHSANTNNRSYLQIGDGFKGRFPVIDIINGQNAISIKSLSTDSNCYKGKDGNVDVDKVVNKVMEYYNTLDGIDITINKNNLITKELVVAVEGNRKLKKEIGKRLMNKSSNNVMKEIMEVKRIKKQSVELFRRMK